MADGNEKAITAGRCEVRRTGVGHGEHSGAVVGQVCTTHQHTRPSHNTSVDQD